MNLLESTRNRTTCNESLIDREELRGEPAASHAQAGIRGCTIPGLKERVSRVVRVKHDVLSVAAFAT